MDFEKRLMLCAAYLHIISALSSSCSVWVEPSWPSTIIVPLQPATVTFDCLPDILNDNTWRISRNISDGISPRFTNERFNRFGIFVTEETQFLIINDTAVNNNTSVMCMDSQTTSTQRIATLHVYKPTLTVVDISDQNVNITWSQLPSSFNVNVVEQFTLMISSSENSVIEELLVTVNQTFYNFKSDEPELACSNFSFSLSSNLTSSMYHGDCISDSNIVQRPLPSLPNITSLETSITYTLLKQPGGIDLMVSFLAASVCSNKYHVTHYAVEVLDHGDIIKSKSTVEHNFRITLSANNLIEDTNLSFQIITSNIIGNRSTRHVTFFTTDVKNVTVKALENGNEVVVKCEFITGSNAQGCMVVLASKALGNSTVKLTRKNPCTTLPVNETVLSHNDTQVLGYDIESDGSVGTLAVPGEIIKNDIVNVICSPIDGLSDNTSGKNLGIIVGVSVIIIIVVVILVALVIIVALYKRKRYLQKHFTQNQEKTQEDSIFSPVYADPVKTRTPGDGDDTKDHQYNTTSHVCCEEKEETNISNNNNYAELNEDSMHIYHVLENKNDRPLRGNEDITPDPEAPALPPPFKPEPDLPPPPVYHDINNLPLRRDEVEINEYATVNKVSKKNS